MVNCKCLNLGGSCEDCYSCELCNRKDIPPLNRQQLAGQESLVKGGFRIQKETALKLIHFAKSFTDNEDELREIIMNRGTELQKKALIQELEDKGPEKEPEEKPKVSRKQKKKEIAEEA